MTGGPHVLLVTDPSYTEAHVEGVVLRVGAALPAGAFGVLLRDKARARASVVVFADRLRAATARSGSLLLVHSDPSLARAIGADGVHFGTAAGGGTVAEVRRAMPSAWLSVATHSDDEVRAAATAGASAVLVSPIFETPGKGPPRGTGALASARAAAGSVTLYALGGVDRARAPACRWAGADGVAVVRALLGASDPVAEARAIAGVFRGA